MTTEPAAGQDAGAADQPASNHGAERRSGRHGWTLIATWSEVVTDVRGLFQAEMATARLEARDNFGFLRRQLIKLVVAAGLLLLVTALGITAIVLALAEQIGLIWSLMAMAGVCALLSLLLLRSATRRIRSRSLLPKDSLGRMSRDLQRLSGKGGTGTAVVRDRHDPD